MFNEFCRLLIGTLAASCSTTARPRSLHSSRLGYFSRGKLAVLALLGVGFLASAGAQAGVLTPNASSIVCTSELCPGITWTAVGGPVTLSSTVTVSGTGFAVDSLNSCTAGLTLPANQSCQTAIYTTSAGQTGTLSAPTLSAGSSSSNVALSAPSYVGKLTAAGNLVSDTLSCANGAVGTTVSCGSGVVITATGGSVTLGNPVVTYYMNPTIPYYNSATTSTYVPASIALGTCTSGLVLASGATCTLGAITMPIAATGTVTSYPIITPASGGYGVFFRMTATGTGSNTGLTADSSALTCPSTAVGGSSSCGTVHLYTNAATIVGASPYASSDAEFTVSLTGDTCAGVSLTTGQNCVTGTVTFTPTSTGTKSTTVTVGASAGNTSFTASGIATAPGSLAATTSTIACGSEANGLTATCATETLTATGGPVTLSATPFASSDSEFTIPVGTCTANLVMATGATCTTGAITFAPNASAGAKSSTITASATSGTGTTFATTGTAVASTSILGTYIYTDGPSSGTGDDTGTMNFTSQTANGAVYSVSGNFYINGYASNPITFINGTFNPITGALAFTNSNGHPYTGTLSGTKFTGTITDIGIGWVATLNATGSLTASTASIACGSEVVGLTATCATETLTATGGPVTLGATPLSSSDSEFTVPNGTCTASLVLASGATCTTGAITFAPTSAGAKSTTISATTTTGGGTTFAASGTAVASTSLLGTWYMTDNYTDTGTYTFTTQTAAGSVYNFSGTQIQNGSNYTFTGTFNPISNALTFTFSSGYASAATLNSSSMVITAPITGTSTVVTLTLERGTLSVGTATIVCGSGSTGATTSCATETLTANGSGVTLSATPFASSDSEFTVPAGTCTANKYLASGATCTTGALSFVPTSVGAKSTTVTVAVSSGTGTTFAATGTGVAIGSVSASSTSLSCGVTTAGGTGSCGALTLTATGGPVTFGATPFSNSDTSDFVVPAGTCASATLSSGATCVTGAISFTPTSLGAKSGTLTINPSSGTGTSVALSGTAVSTLGNLVLAPTLSTSCPGVVVGTAASCGSIEVTASGGPVSFGATLATSSNADFAIGTAGTCTANQTLASGTSCTLGILNFTPSQSSTAESATVTVTPSSGTAASLSFSGTGEYAATAAYNIQMFGPATCVTNPNTPVTCNYTVTWVGMTPSNGVNPAGNAPQIVSSTNSSLYSISSSGCGATASGSCTVSLTFSPTAAGTSTATIRQQFAYYWYTEYYTYSNQIVVSGLAETGTAGSLAASAPSITCPTTGLGATATCSSTETLTANGGYVVFDATPFESSSSQFATMGCASGSVLTAGQSCTATTSFTPSAVGSQSATITPVLSSGTTTSFTASGTGAYGTAVATLTGNNCSAPANGGSTGCGYATISASGGEIILAATPFSESGSAAFTNFSAGTCVANQVLANGASCTIGSSSSPILFTPTALGAASTTVTVSVTSGTGTSFTFNGTGAAGTAYLTAVTSTACPSTVVGTPSNCGMVTIAASGATIQLGSNLGAFTSNAASFAIGTSGTCTANQTLVAGSTCTLGPVSFTPTATGSVTGIFTLTPSAGSAGSLSFTGQTWGTASIVTSLGTSCGNDIDGTGAKSCGYATVTASGGPLSFASPAFTTSGSSEFNVPTNATSGYCYGGLQLAVNASCTIGSAANPITISAMATGAVSSTTTLNLAGGTTNSFTLTATGVVGVVSTYAPTTIACGTASTLQAQTCGTLTLTADGPISFTASPYSFGDAEYSVATSGDTCAGATLTNGQTCTTGVISFTPTVNTPGSHATTLSVARTDGGTAASEPVTGTIATGTATLSDTAATPCAYTTAGSSSSCGTVTVTATGGALQLGATVAQISGTNASEFSITSTGSCAANQVLNMGASCTVGTVSFSPSASGAASATITVVPATGTAGSMNLSGATWGALVATYNSGTAFPSPFNFGQLNVGTGTSTSLSAVTLTATGGPVQFGATLLTQVAGSAANGLTVASNNTCTANQTLSAGSTCALGGSSGGFGFYPTGSTTLGAVTSSWTVNTVGGTGITLSTAGIAGGTATSSAVSCGGATELQPINCGTATITAHGSIAFGANPYTSVNSEFSISTVGDTCINSTITTGNTCKTGAITFTPNTNTTGVVSSTITMAQSDTAASGYISVSGTVADGTPTLSATSSLSCPITSPGSTSNCGAVKITATSYELKLGSPVAVLGNSTLFAFDSSSTCVAGQTLAAGSSCLTGNVLFTPTTSGTSSSTVTVTPTIGAAAAVTFTSTTYGTISTSAVPVTCPATAVSATSTCATVTLTATNGPVTLAATPLSFSDATDFTSGTTCTSSQALASGGTCTVSMTFAPKSAGALANTVTVNVTNGAGTSFVENGTASYGTLSLSTHALTCANATAGTSVNCGTLTLTASAAGPVLLANPILSVSDASDFSVSPGTCNAGTLLAAGASCTTGQVLFAPGTAGVKSSNLNVACTGTGCPASATLTGTGLTYAWSTGSWTPATGSACTTALAQTRAVICQSFDGSNTVTVANSSCTLSEPATSQSVADSGGCGTASMSTIACGTSTVGASINCGSVTVTAVGGPVTLTSGVFSSNSQDFSIPAGACASATLAAGTTCSSATVTFTPSVSGADSTTIAVNTVVGLGTPSSTTATGDGAGGISVAGSANCGTATVAVGTSCGTLTLTASGYTVVLGAAPIASSNSDFAINQGTCANATLNAGQSCTSSLVQFTPSAVGVDSTTYTVSDVSGTGTTFSQSGTGHLYSWISGSWTPATGNACTSSLTQTRSVICQQDDGSTVDNSNCTGTIPATSQTVADYSTCTYAWSASGYSACSGGTASYQYTSWTPTAGCGTNLPQTRTGSCAIDQNSGQETQSVTCLRSDGTTVDGSQCASAGTAPETSIACTPTSGPTCANQIEAPLTGTFTDTSTCTYAWSTSAWTDSSSCSSSDVQTRSVSCTQSDGSTVDNSLCANARAQPTSSQTVSNFSGCTFAWTGNGFSACTGGTGEWAYTTWAPATGCGTTLQSRTATCNVDTNSGTATQTLSCVRSDGTTVDGSNCTGTQPATSESCTPAGFQCANEAALTQSVSLTNGCTDQWAGSAWSTCIGGSATWQYTPWTPAVGSACTTALLQTRTGTCTPTANSGYQSRTVSCQNQAGQTAPDADCAGTKLPATQNCTMTSGYSCGNEGTTSQSVSDLSACAYSWHVSGFGACTGGTGAWTYSAWSPTCGLGSVTQTRTGACSGTANSGRATQTVTCVRTDGVVVANSYCTGTMPATSETCTPTTGFSCGTEGVLTQKVVLSTKCTAVAPTCVPSPTNSCVTTP